jgi:hypothetical protein
MAGHQIEIEAMVSRNHEIVGDRLVRGLVNGGLVGPGWAIERRSAHEIVFRRPGLFPDRGEIGLEPSAEGTVVSCRIWYPSCALQAAGVALVSMGLTVAHLAGPLAWGPALALGLAAAAVGASAAWVWGRRKLRRQIGIFLANTMFLKAS